jgi:hypothetical protein
MKHITITLAFLMTLSTQAASEGAGVKARLAFTHWQCFTYIDFMSEAKGEDFQDNRQKHFDKGYSYAQEMYSILKKSKNEPEDWSSNAPMFFNWSMWGPTAEFAIGRLYEASKTAVGDRLTKKLGGEYIDKELYQMDAYNSYQDENCKLIP